MDPLLPMLSPDLRPEPFSVSFLKKKLLKKWHRLRTSSDRCSWMYLHSQADSEHQLVSLGSFTTDAQQNNTR